MILGYLTSQYGRASDTFVRQEVTQLRRLGHTIHTFSIRRPPVGHNVSEEVRSEQANTDYILESPSAVALAVLALVVTQPLRMLRAIALAVRTCSPGIRAMVWQIIYLFEAAYLAQRLAQLGVQHLHNHIGMNSATVAMLAAELAGIPWSETVHGHDMAEPSRWALPQKLAHASFTVFISDFGRSQGMMLTDPSIWPRLHVVRCGLDETFLEQPATPPPDAPQFVFVGRLAPEKGVLVLIDAIAALSREDVTIELTVIGDGPSRPSVEAAIAKNGLADKVILLGWQSSQRVRDEILRSRALVLPSFAEGLPIVIMEALALHRPVIATYVAGIPELVKPGKCGLLVPAGTPKPLAHAIREIALAAPDVLAAWGQEGADRVRQHHDAYQNVTRLLALFEGAGSVIS
jgi:glycosyltransferase involved in cell wall biosynthesis